MMWMCAVNNERKETIKKNSILWRHSPEELRIYILSKNLRYIAFLVSRERAGHSDN